VRQIRNNGTFVDPASVIWSWSSLHWNNKCGHGKSEEDVFFIFAN